MRKIMLSVVASCALVAFVPASALAHGHGKRHHRGHHARVHHRTFGHDWSHSGAITMPSTSSDQNAGTVQSFTGGVLTIALNDRSTVSGKVTPDTEIECQAPDMTEMSGHDSGDDSGGGDDQGDNHDQGDDQGDNNNQGDDDQGQDDDDQAIQNCDSSSLTPGTVVHEGSLKVSSAGAFWDKVELVTASASTTPGDDD